LSVDFVQIIKFYINFVMILHQFGNNHMKTVIFRC